MTKISAHLRCFTRNEAAATSIEYGVVALIIAVAFAAGADRIGDKVKATLDGVTHQIDADGSAKESEIGHVEEADEPGSIIPSTKWEIRD